MSFLKVLGLHFGHMSRSAWSIDLEKDVLGSERERHFIIAAAMTPLLFRGRSLKRGSFITYKRCAVIGLSLMTMSVHSLIPQTLTNA